MRMTRLFIVLALCAASAFAQAPGWSRGQQTLSITYDECVRRASKSLEAEGYRIDYAAGNFAVGQKSVHTAVITCNASPEGKMAINIIVASNGEGGGSERQQLQARMEGSNPGTTGGTVRPGRYLNVRVNGRVAIVDWENAPTTNGAWVSVVTVGTADGTHIGKWTYTEQKNSGRYESGALDPGTYEARFYGDSGYGKILDRVRFDVASNVAGAGGGRFLNVQLNGRNAIVIWSNAPTSNGAWVSVVPVGTADSTHVGKWVYTNQTTSGTYESGPWSAGDYEARFYGDSGYGQLIERVRFRID